MQSRTLFVTLFLAPGFLLGCDESPTAEQPAPPSRYEAVVKSPAPTETSSKELEGFCDVQPKTPFTLPALSTKTDAPTGARWVNVWATWCKSCIEEMPMIERWEKELGLDVLFVSADEEEATLLDYRKAHPEIPPSAHMSDPESLKDWMKTLNLDAGAGLPLHVFVDSEQKVLCARAGAVTESHRKIVSALLK